MTKKTHLIGSAVLVLCIFFSVGATHARADGLNPVQISAIISLLQSFGADQSVIANVQSSLGQASVTAPAQSPVATVAIGAPTLTVNPTSLSRDSVQRIISSITNAAPNSKIYSSVQAPDGSFLLNNAQISGDAITDQNGNSSGTQIIPKGFLNQGGQWTFWVTVGGKSSNKVPISISSGAVLGNSTLQSSISYVWNNNLEIGSEYLADVVVLQAALKDQGVYAGDITGGFYNQTFQAVQQFQAKYGIETTGYVGPMTREKLNSLYR